MTSVVIISKNEFNRAIRMYFHESRKFQEKKKLEKTMVISVPKRVVITDFDGNSFLIESNECLSVLPSFPSLFLQRHNPNIYLTERGATQRQVQQPSIIYSHNLSLS